MDNSKAGYLKNFNNLFESINSGIAVFSSNLCEFLTDNFDLQAVVLFKVNNNENNFEFLGKSSSAKKSYGSGNKYKCKSCLALTKKNDTISIDSHAECELSPTEFVIYESSLSLRLSADNIFLLKTGKKTPFSEDDNKNLFTVGEFALNLLKNFFEEKEKSNSVANLITEIAHELRTPITNEMGFTSLLSEDSLTASQTEYVNSLKESTLNHLSLINDLIELSKLETNILKESLSNININAFINEVLKFFKSKKNDDVKFLLNISDDISDNVKLDPQKLRAILENIISYSLRLTQKGKITISVSALSKEKLNFKISDTSSGLTNKQIKDIFNPFSLFELGNTKLGSTTGLGLMLAKKYIESLKGEIEVTSSLGKGTTYNFKIAAEQIKNIEQQLSSLPKPGKTNRILVVEDDYAASKLLSNYLTKWGYEPIIVNSAQQALKSIGDEIFLAVLMDIVLPDANGFELLKNIREHKNCKNTPVIVCSIEAEQQKAFLMGAVEYFVKPVKYQYLIEVLHNYKLKRDSNILIVDDDIPTLELIKGAVEQAGFNTVAESKPLNVEEMIANMNLHLAIIDLDMPGINGYQLIKQIKLNPKFKKLPVIIYTGKENYKDDLKKIDGLFEELLEKNSTNIEELSETITQMINRYDEPTPEENLKEEPDSVKILLVEDYKHSQIIVTRLLKKNNFEHIVVCENGAEALEKAKEQKFDLILMDMQMPVMNGFEATEKIRELPEYKDTPIIALTAFAMKGDREKCLDVGATDYIPKPIDSHEFIEKVKHYTASKIGVS